MVPSDMMVDTTRYDVCDILPIKGNMSKTRKRKKKKRKRRCV